jgi:phosphoribosylanthranilate isomerase
MDNSIGKSIHMEFEKLEDPAGKAKIPEAKTIILLGHKGLLGHSVELLLLMQKAWQVIKITNNQSFIKLLQSVKKASPNVVILHQSQNTGDARLLMRLLQDCPGLKVITVNPDNNIMEVYTKQMLWLREVDDLLSAVEG